MPALKLSPPFSTFARILVLGTLVVLGANAQAQTDPLPSLNGGAAKQSILTFIKETTTPGSPRFVDPVARIATFDQDGTTWVEQPAYTQLMFAFNQVAVMASMLVHHDDAAREYAYGPESKVGTFSDALMAEAKQRGWVVISMKRDWKRIFAWQQEGPAS